MTTGKDVELDDIDQKTPPQNRTFVGWARYCWRESTALLVVSVALGSLFGVGIGIAGGPLWLAFSCAAVWPGIPVTITSLEYFDMNIWRM